MKEDKVIDPVKLDLCEYQTVEPLVHPFSLLREENDPVIEVFPYEALVIQDASKLGALESLPNPEPQQEILMEVQNPKNLRTECVLTSQGEEINVQDMDRWSVFTDRLRYTTPATPVPGYDIQGQGCLDFSADRVNRFDQAKSVSMAPLDFKCMQASEYMDRYDGIAIELNVNMDYDDVVEVPNPPDQVTDVRVIDHKARTLRVRVWPHRLDLTFRGDEEAAQSLLQSTHTVGPLLRYFLAPGTANLHHEEVIDEVLEENYQAHERAKDKVRASLAKCTDKRAKYFAQFRFL